MACNSSFHALAPRNPQESSERVCVTSLINRPQLQQNSSTSTDPTLFTHSDLSQSKTALGIERVPKSSGFLSLARELRDIIYSDLITSGDVEILRVSQQLHDEAKEILLKAGIFRMYLNTPTAEESYNIWRPSMLAINNRIQNLNILLYMPSSMGDFPRRLFSSEYDKLTLDYIRSCQGLGECQLTLILQSYDLSSPPEILELIRKLTSFKLVAVRIHITGLLQPFNSVTVARMEPSHRLMLQCLATFLKSALGCPEWRLDTGPSARYQTSTYAKVQPDVSPFRNLRYLEFHPREGNGRAQTGSTMGLEVSCTI